MESMTTRSTLREFLELPYDELEAREGDAFVRAFVEHHMVAGGAMIPDLPSELLDSMTPGQQIRIDRNRYIITSAGGSREQIIASGTWRF